MNPNPRSPVTSKLVCVALNDRDHYGSLAPTFAEAPYKKPPVHPVLYYKPRNTWSHGGASVEIPAGKSLVVGASVGLVIGATCCRVSPESVWDYIEACVLVHDFSLPERSYFRPDLEGKCVDGSAPVGESTPVDRVGDPSQLSFELRVNGETRAALSPASLVRGADELVSHISHIMTLEPGETIAVGFNGRRVEVEAGDEVVTDCDGVASLSNTVTEPS